MTARNGWKLHKTIVLVGMMGAGKTAVGRTLAGMLHVPFLDSDAEIEAAANMSIAEIFARDGEAFFRDREAQVINRLLDEERGILSTGGGAFMQEVNRKAMTEKGISVWLNADLDTLWNRVKHKDTRPLLRTADPYGTLRDLYEARQETYALADVVMVSKPEMSLQDAAEAVIEALANRPDVLEKIG